MDWPAAIPMILDAVRNLSVGVLDAMAQRLLTMVLSAAIVGGVTLFAVTGFAWLWLRRSAEMWLMPRAVPH